MLPETAPLSSTLRQIEELAGQVKPLTSVRGLKPNQVMDKMEDELKDCTPAELAKWRQRGAPEMVLGSRPKTLGEWRTGVKSWVRYVRIAYNGIDVDTHAWPPQLMDVVGWGRTFR